jgi:hypothetical protein
MNIYLKKKQSLLGRFGRESEREGEVAWEYVERRKVGVPQL